MGGGLGLCCTDLDFIERTILQKANSRLQRYRLTARGRMRRIYALISNSNTLARGERIQIK